MKSWSTNDVKIYNLSAGKSLPEWITEKKRRAMQKSDVGIRRRIELIQDFEMPGVSSCVQVSKDGEYILATGIYKPRVRCYDVKNLSMKFERCFDSEVIKFISLSEDYSKLVFLQCDRFVEFHAQYGRYYRLRIPKFGRDLGYHLPSCDLMVVGDTNQIYRLNLELGRFMTPWESSTNARGMNCLAINPAHQLITCGTEEGRVEAWDHRQGSCVASLDVAVTTITEDSQVLGIPAVSSLKYKDGLTLGVGTSTGQVLLYDIRSSKPLLTKDHFYGAPIKTIEFHPSEKLVLSMDSKIVKIWEESSGEAFTSVEGEAELNDLCLVPNTGLFFIANEDKKILSYFIPALGPAPKWCSFLDNLTEEMEESDVTAVYDDYKFVTEKELEELGLTHLKGSSLLRAYMHGYFMDMRLYRKAKAITQPFNFSEFKQRKIKEKLQQEASNRIKFSKLPKVNKELAMKFINREDSGHKKSKIPNLLEDNRFKGMFENPDFEIDKTADEYRLLNPVLSKLENKRSKKLAEMFAAVNEEQDQESVIKDSSDDDDLFEDDDKLEDTSEEESVEESGEKMGKHQTKKSQSNVKFYELKSNEGFKLSDINSDKNVSSTVKRSKATLGDRLITNKIKKPVDV